MGTGILEIVGAAEIILCSRPADRRVFRIAVKIELDLSFSPILRRLRALTYRNQNTTPFPSSLPCGRGSNRTSAHLLRF